MPDPVTAIVGGGASLLSSRSAARSQSRAARGAAQAQTQAAELGIEEQRRQFNEISRILAPYVNTGTQARLGLMPYEAAGRNALTQQQALTGLLGPEAQQEAINQIAQSPLLESQIQQGEQALLQNASATGGLRGGNVQGALAEFRPQLLNQAIQQRYGQLGGLSSMGANITQNLYSQGQASAVRQAGAASGLGSNVANLYGQMGTAQAGGILGQARAAQMPFTTLTQGIGTLGGLAAAGVF